MKVIISLLILLLPMVDYGQKEIDPSSLALIPFKPHITVNKIHYRDTVSINALLTYGLQVVLDDNTFKVVQFDVLYDCPSHFLLPDFSLRRYIGDKVSSSDDYLQKRVSEGDVIRIRNTLIKKQGVVYRMKDCSFYILSRY